MRQRLAVFSHIVQLGDVEATTLEDQARESPLRSGADLDIIEIGDQISVFPDAVEYGDGSR